MTRIMFRLSVLFVVVGIYPSLLSFSNSFVVFFPRFCQNQLINLWNRHYLHALINLSYKTGGIVLSVWKRREFGPVYPCRARRRSAPPGPARPCAVQLMWPVICDLQLVMAWSDPKVATLVPHTNPVACLQGFEICIDDECRNNRFDLISCPPPLPPAQLHSLYVVQRRNKTTSRYSTSRCFNIRNSLAESRRPVQVVSITWEAFRRRLAAAGRTGRALLALPRGHQINRARSAAQRRIQSISWPIGSSAGENWQGAVQVRSERHEAPVPAVMAWYYANITVCMDSSNIEWVGKNVTFSLKISGKSDTNCR